jgi:hypothetical protein
MFGQLMRGGKNCFEVFRVVFGCLCALAPVQFLWALMGKRALRRLQQMIGQGFSGRSER